MADQQYDIYYRMGVLGLDSFAKASEDLKGLQKSMDGVAASGAGLEQAAKRGVSANDALGLSSRRAQDDIKKQADAADREFRRMAAAYDAATREDRRRAEEGEKNARRMAAIQDAAIREDQRRAAEAEKSAKRIEDSFRKQAEASEQQGRQLIQSVQSPFATAATAVENFLLKLGPVGIGILAVGAASVAAGKQMLDFVQEQAEAAQKLQNLATKLNLTVVQTQQLSAAARIAGTNIESLATAERFLSAALEDSTGSGARYAKTLDKLGISIFDASGKSREFGPVLLELIEKLSKVQSATERVNLSNEALGRFGAKQIQPLLRDYERYKDAVRNAGVGNEELNKSLERTAEEFTKTQIAYEQFKRNLAGKLQPIVVPLLFAVRFALGGTNSTQKAANEALTGKDLLKGLEDSETIPGISPALQKFTADLQRNTAEFLIGTEQEQAKKLAQTARVQFDNSKLGLETRKKKLEDDLKEQQAKLVSGNLSLSAQQQVQADATRTQAELDRVESRLKSIRSAASEAKSLFNLLAGIREETDRLEGKANKDPYAEIEQKRVAAIRKALETGAKPSDVAEIDTLFARQKNAQFETDQDKKRKQAAKDAIDAVEEQLTIETAITQEARKRLGLKSEEKTAVEQLLRIQNANTERSLASAAIPGLPAERDPSRVADTARAMERQLALRAREGDEGKLIVAQEQIRLKLADDLYKIAADRAKLLVDSSEKARALDEAQITRDRERYSAQIEAETQVLALRKQQQQQDRENARGLFQALRQGQSGSFFKSFFTDQLDKIGTNALEPVFKNLRQSLGGLGGDSNSPLGKLLAGTIFGNDPVKDATTKNTQATIANTQALLALSGSVGGGALVPGLVGVGTGALSGGSGTGALGSILGGVTSNPLIFNALGAGAATFSGLSGFLGGASRVGDYTGIFTGVGAAPGGGYESLSNSERAGAAASTAAVAVGGGYQAAQAFGRGNTAQGIAATAGTLAALDPEPISKGILALTATLTSIFGGDPKKERSDAIDQQIKDARYREPQPVTIVADTSGKYVDYDKRGNTRSANFSAYAIDQRDPYADNQGREFSGRNLTPLDPGYRGVTVIQNFSMLDGRAIMDRKDDFADAVRAAMDTGHPINESMQEVVNPR